MQASFFDDTNEPKRKPEKLTKEQIAELYPVLNGEIWTLGDHRLLCGDSTNLDNVGRVMGGEKAKAIIQDPPYSKLTGHVIETGVTQDDCLPIVDNFLNDGFYVYTGMQPTITLWNYKAMQHGLTWAEEIVWDKVSASYYLGEVNRHHELIEFFKVGKAKLNKVYTPLGEGAIGIPTEGLKRLMSAINVLLKNPIKTRLWADMVESGDYTLAGFEDDNRNDLHHKRQSIKQLKGWVSHIKIVTRGRKPPSIIRCLPHNKANVAKGGKVPHPTVKPIPLFEILVKLVSNKDDIILDPFCGSGTTLLASHITGRRCYAIELNEMYCSVILWRFERTTGIKPVRINDLPQ